MLLTTYVSTLWKSQSSIEANTRGNDDAIITRPSTRNIVDAWNSTKLSACANSGYQALICQLPHILLPCLSLIVLREPEDEASSRKQFKEMVMYGSLINYKQKSC